MRPQIDDTLQKILVTAAQSVKAGQIILVLKNVQQMIKLI
jgi:multidrug efflux pump subunit AcrA (membrane-fusion protein)